MIYTLSIARNLGESPLVSQYNKIKYPLVNAVKGELTADKSFFEMIVW